MACTRCGSHPVWSRGHCRRCYDQVIGTEELPVLHPKPRVNFEEWLASVIGTPGCWVWPGGVDGNGYGRATVNGKRWKVHQHVWERLRGPVPEGFEPDHLCRNRACANPDCQEIVTHKVNMQRADTPAARNAALTHCLKAGHPFDGDNVITARDGKRRCRTCHLEWRRQRRVAGLPA